SQFVGVGEGIAAQGDISIFPNPSDGNFTINFTEEHPFNSIEIVSPLGKVYYKKTIDSKTKSITVGDGLKLAKGIYFVKFNEQKNYVVKKVMIK
ncbi:MAG: hypothetical protein DRI88_08820, partial [Bacteroidetes bacterium]